MLSVSKRKLAFVFLMAVFVASCGGGQTKSGSSTKNEAIEKIANYAKNAGLAPTIEDYVNAGVSGVDAENLEIINNKVSGLHYEDVDTKQEIQALLDELNLDITDTTPPVITLKGANPLTLVQGEEYIEAGADAEDNRDIHVDVMITGSVDVETVGTYTITYTAKDKAGNTSSVERNVKVVSNSTPDTTKPIIVLYGLNPMSIIKGSTYTEAGATATDDRDGEVEIIITGEVDTTKVGTYTITYTAKDKAKNTASKTRTVNVVINDTTPPDTTKPVIVLNGDSTITLIKGSSYTEEGATATDDRDGIVTVSISGEVNTNVIGSYTITYTAEDKAKNKSTKTRTIKVEEAACSQVITHAYNPDTNEEQDFATPCDVPEGWTVGNPPVEVDSIAPVITLLGNASITLSVGDSYEDAGATASDNKDGNLSNDIVTNNPVNTAVADTYIITYNVDDAAGNHASQVTRTVTVNPVVSRAYGEAGNSTVAAAVIESVNGNSVIIMPEGVTSANPIPVVFFAPGFRNTNYTTYQTLLNFIASHGYAVIYAKDIDGFSANSIMTHLREMVNNPAITPLLDTSRMGIIGHSSGGGHAFRILKEFSALEGWGTNGRFLLALEPWFAFDLTKEDMKSLPSNSRVVIQQYGEGGNNAVNDTDPRIPLTEFYLLDSIANNQKDYQIVVDADHHYPYGSDNAYSAMQGILKPLDALMELTFKENPDAGAQQIALEVGDDNPYNDGHGIQTVKLIRDYGYKCYGSNTIINYCAIHTGARPPESGFFNIPTNTEIPKPALKGKYIDREFGKEVTRMTDRISQNDDPKVDSDGNKRTRANAHPYPKTQAWNSDMSMIRLGYRIYDAQTLDEISLKKVKTDGSLTVSTTDTNSLSVLYTINGYLSEIKWSNVDPNVFYGVYNGSGDYNGNFWKGTINPANNTIQYDLVKSFASVDYTFDYFTLGKYEGNIDFNDHYVAFAARKEGQKYLTAIVYDMQNNSVVKIKEFPDIAWPDQGQVFDWLSISPLGNHVLFSTGGKIDQYDRNLNLVLHLAQSGGHGDLGIDVNGTEAYVQYEYGGNNGIWIYRLNDGRRIKLLPDKYNGGHISCRNYDYLGWCYASTTSPDYKDIIAIRLDYTGPDNHIVRRFVQTQTSAIVQSMGNVSPDGKQVLFETDWGDNSVHWTEKDTYLAR